MSIVLYVVSFLSAFFAGVGILCLGYLVCHTYNVTDFLCVCNWFGKYMKISQRIRNKSVVEEIHEKYRNMPIREQIAEYGRLFEADFNEIFDKLQPGIHYRVTTHYKRIMERAIADGKIKLICPVKELKNRTLRELKPLLGRMDYRLARKCVKKNPQAIRCCDKCKRISACQCRRGGICSIISEKGFARYDFEIV